jgi:hypothetical protein
MAATKEQIQEYLKQLKSRDKKSLIEEYQRSHRVSDVRGMGKDDAISYLLEDKFGRNYGKILFGNSNAFTNGRNRALQEIANKVQNAEPTIRKFSVALRLPNRTEKEVKVEFPHTPGHGSYGNRIKGEIQRQYPDATIINIIEI